MVDKSVKPMKSFSNLHLWRSAPCPPAAGCNIWRHPLEYFGKNAFPSAGAMLRTTLFAPTELAFQGRDVGAAGGDWRFSRHFRFGTISA